MFLLQIPVDSLSTQAAAAASAPQSLSLLDLAIKGGWGMIPLLLLSVVGTYVFLERMLVIRRAKKDPQALLQKVKDAVLKGDLLAAQQYCDQERTPMASMLRTGLSHLSSPLKTIEASIENTGKLELYRLEKNVDIIGMVSGAAPMVGFLGTVAGMIVAFMAIAQEEGAVSPKMLSSGIYEAMITTAGGLIVGICAYVAYNYLVRQVQEVIHHMEVTSIEFIDLLQRPN